jgi:hypothetical protein
MMRLASQPAATSKVQMVRVETELQVVQRHIREGKAILVRQHAVVERLRTTGFATDQAEVLLSNFHDFQALHEEHQARIIHKDRGSAD